MSVLAAPRPPDTALGRDSRGDGGAPARRAIVRWAWRLFRRQWRQQLLVLALLSLAVGATTMGLAVASNTVSGVDAVMGLANTRLTIAGTDPNLAADIAKVRQEFGNVEVTAHQKIPVPGSVSAIDMRDQDPRGLYGYPTLRVVTGRYPDGSDEVAVTGAVASTFGLHVGDSWNPDGRNRRVVGLVENPQNLLDQFALVAPGQTSSPTEVSILTSTSMAKVRDFRLGTALNIDARGNGGRTAAAIAVLALGTTGMLFVGLVAVAGFTVMAQRRLRAIGMLGAIGATYRHVRFAMVANGGVVGGVAAVVGAMSGLVGWLVFVPHLETLSGHRIDRFDIPWWAIFLAMLLAVVTAVAAAWWPARAAARIPIVAALAGRPPRPQPAHHFAALGCVFLGAGLPILVFANRTTPSPLVIISGISATTVGLLLLVPLPLAGLAALAGRAPLSLRLALRDLGRYRARSGAALAAITLAIGIAATIALSASAAQAKLGTNAGNLPADQLLVQLGGGHFGAAPLPELLPGQVQELQSRVEAMGTMLHARDVLPLDTALMADAPGRPQNPKGPGGRPPAALVKVSRDGGGIREELVASLYVATPRVLDHYGIRPEKVDSGADVLTSRTDLGGLKIDVGGGQTIDPKIQTFDLPKYTSGPSVLITTEAVQRYGLQAEPAGWLIQMPAPLTAEQINAARHAAASAGVTIETRVARTSLAQLRNWSTLIGIVVALVVLAMTVGLIRAETASDLRILTATGASSTIRRNLTSCTAGALALLGAVMGTAGAYAALVAWYRSDLRLLGQPPLLNLAVIVAGLPLAAVMAGWVLAGREPRAIAERPLE